MGILYDCYCLLDSTCQLHTLPFANVLAYGQLFDGVLGVLALEKGQMKSKYENSQNQVVEKVEFSGNSCTVFFKGGNTLKAIDTKNSGLQELRDMFIKELGKDKVHDLDQ